MNLSATVFFTLASALWMKAAPFSISDRLAQYEEPVRLRLAPDFQQARVSWPAPRLTFLAFKQERLLEVWTSPSEGVGTWIKTYSILAASGRPGPKLREGDHQVPEGFYRIESLNPNSRFHLSLRLNYPNAFDLTHARAEGRSRPGSDIMIHGGASSVGCLALGDPAAEELFVLTALAGPSQVQVIIAPVDFRAQPMPDLEGLPAWTGALYQNIHKALQHYPRPHPPPGRE